MNLNIASRLRRTGAFLGTSALVTVLYLGLSAAPTVSPAEASSLENDTYNWETTYQPLPRSTEVFEGQFEHPMLGERTEDAMLQAIAHYQIIVRRGGWVAIPEGNTLVTGSRGPRVEVLAQRLMITGDLVPPANFDPSIFDENIAAAVSNFQSRHGLSADGRVDYITQAALNVPAEDRLRTLELNLDRVREFASGLSSRYVVVNIAAAELEAVQGGYLYSRHVTIVGKVDRPSPQVASEIVQLNFNPYWHAPVSIVEKDILPQLRQSTSYIKQLNIRVFEGSYYGNEVDPDSIDWSQVDDPTRYFFRQEPGESNAMATVRINFPNEHDVYLHDTPQKSLFLNSARYDSSGCVRIDEVDVFVEWLLRDQGGWDLDRVQQVGESRERMDVEMNQSVPLRIVYLTAWATANNDVHFRHDIYSLDVPGGSEATDQSGTAEPAAVQNGENTVAQGGNQGEDAIGAFIDDNLITGSTSSDR